MRSDFDWLDYLSMLSPRTSLHCGGSGGVARVARDDVVASLAGIGMVPSLLVDAFVGALSVDVLADRTCSSAFVSALVLNEPLLSVYSPAEFGVVWREVCRDFVDGMAVCGDCTDGFVKGEICSSCGGAGHIQRSSRSYAVAAGVSRDKWVRLYYLMPVSRSVLDKYVDTIRVSLRRGLVGVGGGEIPVGIKNIDRASHRYLPHH